MFVGQMVTVKDGEVNIGANPSAEDGGDGLEDGARTVNDIVDGFRLTVRLCVRFLRGGGGCFGIFFVRVCGLFVCRWRKEAALHNDIGGTHCLMFVNFCQSVLRFWLRATILL